MSFCLPCRRLFLTYMDANVVKASVQNKIIID